MPVEPIREAALRLLAQAIAAAFPEAKVERNRIAAAQKGELPLICILDADHAASDGPELGNVTYDMKLAVTYEGIATTAAGRGALLQDAQARLAAAICGGASYLPDGQPFWPEETDFTPDLEGGESALPQAVGFTVTYRFELIAPRGAPFVTHGPAVLGAWVLGEGRLAEGMPA